MSIESVIESSIEVAQQNGLIIIAHKWGIRLFNEEWICKSGYCCPLGATLLEHQLVIPADDPSLFKGGTVGIDLRDVRMNPSYCIVKLLEVDYEWLQSFYLGIQNMKLGYYSDTKAYDLGLKYYQEYGGVII